MFDFETTNQNVKQRNYISGTRIARMCIRSPGLKKCYRTLLAGGGQVKNETIICSFRVCNHVIAVYSENKLQHYATAFRNHKSAGEKFYLVSNLYFSSKPC